MKLLLILPFILLAGCVTRTLEDGTTVTEFDPEKAGKAIDTGFSVWDRYNARRYPDRPIYSPYGPTLYHPAP